MVSVTFQIKEQQLVAIEQFPWINWSEIAREEMRKKEIFEEYMETKELSDEDWKFCEKINWHPVDELPLKEEFKKELETRKKEKGIRFNSVEEIFK